MLAFGVHKGSQYAIFVQLEVGLAMPWCKPWRPNADQREPPGACQQVVDQAGKTQARYNNLTESSFPVIPLIKTAEGT